MSLKDKSGAETTTWCYVCAAPENVLWAEWLGAQLGEYTVPPRLVGAINSRGEPVPGLIRPVVIKVSAVGEALTDEDYAQLRKAKYLLVICSPEAARSEEVDDIIRIYKSYGFADKVLAAVVDGLPNATNPAESGKECFPQALRFEVTKSGDITEKRCEPLAADFRVQGKDPAWFDVEELSEALEANGIRGAAREEICKNQLQRVEMMRLKVIAGIIGVDLGNLTERDKIYRSAQASKKKRRALLQLALFGALALAGVGAFFYKMKTETDQQSAELLRKQSAALAQSSQGAVSELARKASLLRAEELMHDGEAYQNGAAGKTKSRENALQCFRESVALGYVPAELCLGKLLIEGGIGSTDSLDGLELIRSASKKGNAAAQLLLSEIYLAGKLIIPNASEALRLAELAARQEYPAAMISLGGMLERNMGGDTRVKEALTWYVKAANAGDSAADFRLYFLYLNSRSELEIPKDQKIADAYLEKAIKKGWAPALAYRGRQLLGAAGKNGSVSPALALFQQGASQGDRECLYEASKILERGGPDIASNIELAKALLLRAAEAGSRMAALELATNLLNLSVSSGSTAAADLQRQAEIHRWFKFAAEQLPVAMCNYGDALIFGTRGLARDVQNGRAYLRQAVDTKYPEAQRIYGYLAVQGRIPEVTAAQGVAYLIAAAENPNSPNNIPHIRVKQDTATYLMEGKIVPRDLVKAEALLNLAPPNNPDTIKLKKQLADVKLEGVLKPGEQRRSVPVAGGSPMQKEEIPKTRDEASILLERIPGKLSGDALAAVMNFMGDGKGFQPKDYHYLGRQLLLHDDERGLSYSKTFIDWRMQMTGVEADGDERARSWLGPDTLCGARFLETQVSKDSSRVTATYHWFRLASVFSSEDGLMGLVAKAGKRLPPKEVKAIDAQIQQQLNRQHISIVSQTLGRPAPVLVDDSFQPPKAQLRQLNQLIREGDGLIASSINPLQKEKALPFYRDALKIQPNNLSALVGAARGSLKQAHESFFWYLQVTIYAPKNDPAIIPAALYLAREYRENTKKMSDKYEFLKWHRIATMALKQSPVRPADLKTYEKELQGLLEAFPATESETRIGLQRAELYWQSK